MRQFEANLFVLEHHRHNRPVVGSILQMGVSDGQQCVGVGIAGRPVSRSLDDGETLEVLRVCVLEGAPKGACSFLYASLWRAARALGYRKMVTYTLAKESGASLRGAGWHTVAEVRARAAFGWQTRPGRNWYPAIGQAKLRWEATAPRSAIAASAGGKSDP